MCLQGMVDELIMKKEGRKITKVTSCLLLFIVKCLFFHNFVPSFKTVMIKIVAVLSCT